MPVYVLGQLTLHDRARYDRYVSRFLAVLRQYEGRLLVSDEQPTVIEGHWPHDKVVLIEFVDVAHFERWATSDEYTRIATDRTAATNAIVLVMRGVGQS